MLSHLLLTGAAAFRLASAQSPSRLVRRDEPWDSWKPGVSWQIVVRETMDLSDPATFQPHNAVVWDVDLFASASQGVVTRLKANHLIVICHFSAGSVSEYDPDYANFTGSVGNLSGWDEDEHYVDVSDPAVLAFMKSRINLAVQAGCDGVDLDNVDAWADDDLDTDYSGFGLPMSAYGSYVQQLAMYAHGLQTAMGGRPLMVGQRNAPDLVDTLSPVCDFAVLESCLGLPSDADAIAGDEGSEYTYSFCDAFQEPYAAKGKPVFQIEYPESLEVAGGKLNQTEYDFYCAETAATKGFSEVLKRWNVSGSEGFEGWTQYCGAGVDGDVYTTSTLPLE